MGSMTFSVVRGSPAVNGSKTFTIPDAQVTRFFQWAQAAYPTMPDGVDANGVPKTRAATLGESLVQWAEGIMKGTVANVQSYERSAAAKNASDAINPIQPT